MSFTFSYVARSKQRAKDLATKQLDQSYVPKTVVAFIHDQIDGTAGVPDDAFIQVSASGHSCQGNSYDTQGSATIMVTGTAITE